MTVAPHVRPFPAPARHTPRQEVFDKLESRVRSYARSFGAVFKRAEGTRIFDEHGRSYLDFLSGAGSLNYGHNHPVLRDALMDYIGGNGIAHSLDLHTVAKAGFLEAFETRILRPRQLEYVAQFTGPTGANAVEAALKLARKVTGRHPVVSFTNGFHGVTLGALAATGNSHHRGAAGVDLAGVIRMPFDGYLGPQTDTLDYFEKTLGDASSGIDRPAAVIVETIQGEGGLNVATARWLKRLQVICRAHDVLLIIDDIQAGCGRSGRFFSFEEAGIVPDIITLSKSLSGMGLPFAVVLLRRELDIWRPGEHNGTFRGNNHAFVTATAALNHFWADDGFAAEVRRKAGLLHQRLAGIAREHADGITLRGRGMMQGLAFSNTDDASAVSREAYRRGLIIETAGPEDEVLKCLCPLTITDDELREGLDTVEASVKQVLAARRPRRAGNKVSS
ncbi:MAG: diaminobutyrate--2-oxoglutarate transaminase [Gammaproteobacteria bacterium]